MLSFRALVAISRPLFWFNTAVPYAWGWLISGRPLDAPTILLIAYFTFPGEEGRGVATAMAKALVQVASEGGSEITVVRAHTLPERNASCRVLEKVEFQRAGDVIDPEDGPVWRWERSPHSRQ